MKYLNNDIATIYSPSKIPISVIIPAANPGIRMRSYGSKSLLPCRNKTVVESQVKIINQHLYNPDIILVTGFESQKVNKHITNKKLNVKCVENENWENENIVGSIKVGLSSAKHKNILIVYGDVAFNKYALQLPISTYSLILTEYQKFMNKDSVGCITNNNQVEQLMYDIPNKWCNIVYFSKNDYECLNAVCNKEGYERRFGFEMINKMIEYGCSIKSCQNKNSKVIDIIGSKDINRIEKEL